MNRRTVAVAVAAGIVALSAYGLTDASDYPPQPAPTTTLPVPSTTPGTPVLPATR